MPAEARSHHQMGRRPSSAGRSLDGAGMASLAEFGFGVPKRRASAEGGGNGRRASAEGDRRTSGDRAGPPTTAPDSARGGGHKRNSVGDNGGGGRGRNSVGFAPPPFDGARVGAELASSKSLLLWFHEDRADCIESALGEGLWDTFLEPLERDGRWHVRQCSYEDLQEERRRRRDPARRDDQSSVPGPPVKAAIDSVAAMKCSLGTRKDNARWGVIVAWELQFDDTAHAIAGYEKIAKCLYDAGVVDQSVPPFARNCHLKEWIPFSTRRALTAPKVLASDEEVDDVMRKIPERLKRALFPFQEAGVRFGLKRRGRCLIGDQMGVGKTLQALALGSCYLDEGPLLVIAPKSMRLTWARELERWLPELRPKNLLVCDSQNQATAPLRLMARAMRIRDELGRSHTRARAAFAADGEDALEIDDGDDEDISVGGEDTDAIARMEATEAARKILDQPRVVVVAYKMCQLLGAHIRSIRWGAVIVDESHTLRTTPSLSGGDGCESEQTATILRMIRGSKPEYARVDPPTTRGWRPISERVVLCSGTPSLTKPFDMYNQIDALQLGLLGDKKTFMHAYCDFHQNRFGHHNVRGGKRFAEYQVLLRNVMIRRLKSDVANDLPAKRRDKVYVDVTKDDMSAAWRHIGEQGRVNLEDDGVDCEGEPNSAGSIAKMQAIGLAKARGASEWIKDFLSIEQGGDISERDWRELGLDEDQRRAYTDSLKEMPKTVIFAHHRLVMDYVEDKVLRKMPRDWDDANLPYIRFDGSTPGQERDAGCDRFKNDDNCRVALVSVTAGGVGIDFSRGSVVIFVELPLAHLVEQAEDRVHRQGVADPVTVYYLVARGAGEWHDRKRLESIDVSLDTTRRALGDHDAADARGLDVRNRKSARGAGPGGESPGGESPADDDDDDDSNPRTTRDDLSETRLDWFNAAARERRCGEDEERSYVEPPPPDDLWFEYSGATQRVHLHGAADGSAPLGQSFDPNDVCRTERRLRAELDQTVPADVKRKRWTRSLEVRLSDAAADDGLIGGDKSTGFSRSHAPRLWGRVDAVFAAAAYVHELEALKAEDKNTIARVHACVRGSIKDYIHGAIDSSGNSSRAGAGAGSASTTRHGGGRREPLPEHAEWRPVLIANVRGRGDPREAKEPVSLGWEETASDGTKKTVAVGTPLCLKCMRPRDGANPLGDGAPDLNLDSVVHVRAYTQTIAAGPRTVASTADLFCSEECAEADAQTRSAAALRRACFERDRGVCAECGLDCDDLVRRIRVMRCQDDRRDAVLAAWPAMGHRGNGGRLSKLAQTAASGHAWECDHVRAVYDGGGECTVDNCQTLCVLCHKARTAAQAKERAERRKAEKEKKEKKGQGTIQAGFAVAHLANCVDLTALEGLESQEVPESQELEAVDWRTARVVRDDDAREEEDQGEGAGEGARWIEEGEEDDGDADADSAVPETDDDEADENIAPTQSPRVLPAKRKKTSLGLSQSEEHHVAPEYSDWEEEHVAPE